MTLWDLIIAGLALFRMAAAVARKRGLEKLASELEAAAIRVGDVLAEVKAKGGFDKQLLDSVKVSTEWPTP